MLSLSSASAKRDWASTATWVWFSALIGLLFGLQSLMPLSSAVKIGADEDFEFSKATLCLRGYHLYTQIWDDQPPLHTWLLTQLFRNVSLSALAARLLTIAFAGLLLFSFFTLVKRISGLAVAVISTGMLILAPGFLELSVSCMQELPALAPVVLTFLILLAAPRSKWCPPEIVAGAFFAWGLQMKLIGLVYCPIILFIFWLRAASGCRGVLALIKPVLMFALSSGMVFFLINVATGNSILAQFDQSWGAHFAPAKTLVYGSPEDHPFDWIVLLRNWDTTVPALLGLCLALKGLKRSSSCLLPFSWFGLTLAVFALHKPWWSYYYVHNSLPLCWCAGLGIVSLAQLTWTQRQKPLQILCPLFLSLALAWSATRVFLEIRSVNSRPRIYTSLVLKEIQRYRPFCSFMFTDQPVYSFHAQIPMPPRLAMISLKRMWSGALTVTDVVNELESTKPGLMLLANDAKDVPYQSLLSQDYRLVYQDPNNRLYARRDIAGRAPLRELQ